jgi:hypothetical protein
MIVPPGPILFLFLALGLSKLVILPVILFEKPVPSAVLMVIPMVIVLVLSIVNATILLRRRNRRTRSHDHRRRPQRRSQTERCYTTLYSHQYLRHTAKQESHFDSIPERPDFVKINSF